MIFKDLIKKTSFNQISSLFKKHYPKMKNYEGFKVALDMLKKMKAKKSSDLRIVLENVVDGLNEKYVRVFGLDKKYSTLQEYKIQYEKDEVNATYGLDFIDWKEILAMEIEENTSNNFSENDIVIHVLWEMTFFGYNNKEVLKTAKEITSRLIKTNK